MLGYFEARSQIAQAVTELYIAEDGLESGSNLLSLKHWDCRCVSLCLDDLGYLDQGKLCIFIKKSLRADW